MSLNGALQIGRSALVASQAGIQVVGNNMANAATEGYHRRSIHLSPLEGEVIGRGQIVGRGVQLTEIRREIDTALQSRLRHAISDENRASVDARFLSAIETLQGELTANDLSTLLSTFFNSFSELANTPEDNAVRSVVIQQGQALADRVASLRSDYNNVIDEIDRDLATSVDRANDLLEQIAGINGQIARFEPGVGDANALRDQRDLLIDELAGYLDVTVIEQPSGSVDILAGSVPILLAGESRGVTLRSETINGALEVSIRVAADGRTLEIDSGRIGGLLRQRQETVEPMIADLDEFAAQLIFQVNRLHSQGQSRATLGAVNGTYTVDDTTANLNAAAAGLPFRIENGSFFVHVTHDETGTRTTHRIDVDGDAMSLDDLINEINVVVGVPNVTASVGVDTELVLTADAGFGLSFSDDTSGALAALGINTFFDGAAANDISINSDLLTDPGRLSAAAGHVAGSNGTALSIATLQGDPIDDLGGRSLREFWQGSINGLAVRADAANSAIDSAVLVREGLAAQAQGTSGVSIDEESINLLLFQRQFQAAARFITTIDETLQTLLSIA